MIEFRNKLLGPETIARFCREWNKKKGSKNMRALTTAVGDRIEIGTVEPTGNRYMDTQLLYYDGIVVMENEMKDDLISKKKRKK